MINKEYLKTLIYQYPSAVYPANVMHELYSQAQNAQSSLQVDNSLTEDELTNILGNITNRRIGSILFLSSRSMNNSHLIRIVRAFCSEGMAGQVKLRFSNNTITDAGIQAIVLSLQKCKTITEMDLSYNEITDFGAKLILTILEENYSITELDLSHNSVSAELQSAVQNRLGRNRRIQDALLNEQQKYDYYVEFLLVTKLVGLPKDLNNLLLEYCTDVPAEAVPFLPKDLYPKVLAEVEQLGLNLPQLQAQDNLGPPSEETLSAKLKALQKQLQLSKEPEGSLIAEQEPEPLLQYQRALQFSEEQQSSQDPLNGKANIINSEQDQHTVNNNGCCIIL